MKVTSSNPYMLLNNWQKLAVKFVSLTRQWPDWRACEKTILISKLLLVHFHANVPYPPHPPSPVLIICSFPRLLHPVTLTWPHHSTGLEFASGVCLGALPFYGFFILNVCIWERICNFWSQTVQEWAWNFLQKLSLFVPDSAIMNAYLFFLLLLGRCFLNLPTKDLTF